MDGHKELYRYDAITDKEEKMNLPIQATWGYTDLWLSKDERYIFIAAEERYSEGLILKRNRLCILQTAIMWQEVQMDSL